MASAMFPNSCSNYLSSSSSSIPRNNVIPDIHALVVGTKPDMNLLHRVLGHPNNTSLAKVCSILNISFSVTALQFCDACKIGKMHQFPHTTKPTKSTKPFDLIHTDLWGPASTHSSHGFKYYVHFVDDFTMYTWIYPLTLKSEACQTVKHFIAIVKTQFSTDIKAIQSDWEGGEGRIQTSSSLSSIFRCSFSIFLSSHTCSEWQR